MKTRIAILGVGRWGVHWVRNFLHHPQAEIVAIADPNATRLKDCRDKFNLDEDKIILATTYESIRELKNLDAVVICTPATTHYSLIEDALKLGYHVLAEKPLTLDAKECLYLTQLARQQQKQLFIDHTYLFHPAVERGEQIVKYGELGDLRYGYASRTHLGPVRQDVDALWDLAIHDIAIFNCWLGQTPIQVQARGNMWLQKGVSDLVWVTLTYPNGFMAYIHLCWLNPDKQRRLTVVGNQGSLIFDELSTTPLTLQRGHLEQEGEIFIPNGVSSEVIEIEKAEPLGKVCASFLNAIAEKNTPIIASGETATELVNILNCLTLSLENGLTQNTV